MKTLTTRRTRLCFRLLLFCTLYLAAQTPVFAEKPQVALYPLHFDQYAQKQSDAADTSTLISSLLLSKFGESQYFNLLDRSLVSQLFEEKSLILTSSELDNQQASLSKLPVSDFTIVGSLYKTDNRKSFVIKLIKNSSSEILGIDQFEFTLHTLENTIERAAIFIDKLISSYKEMATTSQNIILNRVSIGHFSDISETDFETYQGRLVTDNLIQYFAKNRHYKILSRTQVFPLFFEELLRQLQYTNEKVDSKRLHSNYHIYGKYRFIASRKELPLSIYLYIDRIKYGRQLHVIKARDWQHATQLISDMMSQQLPVLSTSPPNKQQKESHQYFLKALAARGMLYDKSVLDGSRPPEKADLESFASNYKPKALTRAMAFINLSLQLNPENKLSQLALAMHQRSVGDIDKSEQPGHSFLNSSDAVAVDRSYQLLQSRKRNLDRRLPISYLESVFDKRNAAMYRELLVSHGFLQPLNELFIRPTKKLNDLINYPHLQRLGDLDADTTIQVLESARSFYYYPGIKVNYRPPQEYRSKDGMKKRTFYQQLRRDHHDIEANIHMDIALSLSQSFINAYSSPPSIDLYTDLPKQSPKRRRSDLQQAIEAFSSTLYLDSSYLEAMIMLGNSLCQNQISRCTSRDMVFNWVIDNVEKANLNGRSDSLMEVTKEIKEHDRLIFLAADAINRVSEKNITALLTYELATERYLSNKYLKMIATLQKQQLKEPSPDSIKTILVAHALLIRAQCFELDHLSDKHINRYNHHDSLDKITVLTRNNPELSAMSKQLLDDIRHDYPNSYSRLQQSISGKLNIATAPDSAAQTTYNNANTSIMTIGETEPVKNMTAKAVEKDKIDRYLTDTINLFNRKYQFNEDSSLAITGKPYSSSKGPIKASDFTTLVTNTRRINTVTEALFKKAYIDIKGIPNFNFISYKDLANDFPAYSSIEIRGLEKALDKAIKRTSAGLVKIEQKENNTWTTTSTLTPDDATENRKFGSAVSLGGNYAFICDFKDGVYIYKLEKNNWNLQHKLNLRCDSVTNNNQWAVIASRESITILKNQAGRWEKSQQLKSREFVTSKNNIFFGRSSTMNERYFVIGNDNGGSSSKGEAYLFSLSNQVWRLSHIFSAKTKGQSFGSSLLLTSSSLYIGAPGAGDKKTSSQRSGMVFHYEYEKPQWELKSTITAKDRPKHTGFGNRLHFDKASSSLLIGGRSNIYSYRLSQ